MSERYQNFLLQGRKYRTAMAAGVALFSVATAALFVCLLYGAAAQNAVTLGIGWRFFALLYGLDAMIVLGYQGWNVTQKALLAKWGGVQTP